MPELPEVETIARQLRAHGVEGRKILSVRVDWPRMVEPHSVAGFACELRGKTIDSIARVGKWMLFSLGSGRTIMIHLRMSGGFSTVSGPHDRIVLELSDGLILYFSDPRKFGRWKLVDNPSTVLDELGPDALTRRFSLAYFKGIHGCRRMIKPLLLDQSVVAGLGNIYADEALWEARIHPKRISGTLSDAELELLYKAIRNVLRTGVDNRGTSLGEGKANYRDLDGETGGHREQVKAYGRSGKPCARCGTPLEKTVVAQRGTTFCPVCQTIA